MIRRAGRAALAGLACLAALHAAPARAAALRYCDAPLALSASQQGRLLRFAAVARAELEASGATLAVVSRAGLDLARFGQRYSHAGIGLRDSPNAPWSVRQLYYACDEQRPRLFDQGLPGFLLGSTDAERGWVSLLLLPAPAAAALQARALHNALALQLLGGSYSANAYPFSTRHQNCNQWLLELMASAWGPAGDQAGVGVGVGDVNGAGFVAGVVDGDPDAGPPARARAQAWLRERGYEPAVFAVNSRPLMWLANALPWLHDDDHPREDLRQALYRVTMPASIEAFVRATLPAAERLELCFEGERVVVRRGWQPIADGCVPGPQDRSFALD